MNQKIKNKIGDSKGYAKCDYSGRTFMDEETITVWYTPTKGHMFSKEGVKNIPNDNLINYTKQIIKMTIDIWEELKAHPKFEMWVERIKVRDVV